MPVSSPSTSRPAANHALASYVKGAAVSMLFGRVRGVQYVRAVVMSETDKHSIQLNQGYVDAEVTGLAPDGRVVSLNVSVSVRSLNASVARSMTYSSRPLPLPGLVTFNERADFLAGAAMGRAEAKFGGPVQSVDVRFLTGLSDEDVRLHSGCVEVQSIVQLAAGGRRILRCQISLDGMDPTVAWNRLCTVGSALLN
ncbi:MAG: hypothetical protein ACT4TC_09585 [Myxococcaceae bacterium]